MNRIGICFHCTETFIGDKTSMFCNYCLKNADKNELDELRLEAKQLLKLVRNK